MNIPKVEMSASEATERLKSYRSAIRRRRLKVDGELEKLIAGYQALATGFPLIDLSAAIGSGGWDAEGRPNLAIARADRQFVTFRRRGRISEIDFDTTVRSIYTGRTFPTLLRRIPLSAMPTENPRWNTWRTARAPVPIIPPDVVPSGAGRLSSLYVLWEVDDWDDVPVDPYLLKPIAGSTYAVIAEWDLTELERSVLRERLA